MAPASAPAALSRDRKSTRLNSSHLGISYAVFCLKKKKFGKRKFPFTDHAVPRPCAVGLHRQASELNWIIFMEVRADFLFFFFLMKRRPPEFPLFPHTASFPS